MSVVAVCPVEVIGSCPAGITTTDEFEIADMALLNPAGHRVCFMAVAQLPIGQGVWQLQSGERFFSHVSCPGCSSDPERENRVVFLLSHADKRELSHAISEYLRLWRRHVEPDTARRLKEEAIHFQSRGDYTAAARHMASAVEQMRRLTGP